jgi:hypothetical protein
MDGHHHVPFLICKIRMCPCKKVYHGTSSVSLIQPVDKWIKWGYLNSK